MGKTQTIDEHDVGFFSQLQAQADSQETASGTKRRSRPQKRMGSGFTRPFSGATKKSAPSASIQPVSANVVSKLTGDGESPTNAKPATTKTSRSRTSAARPVQQQQTNAPQAPTSTLPMNDGFDVRNISSRQMNQLGQMLYQQGRIGREELAMLSFQPELSSTYDQVGAEGIQRPDPDRPRDALAEWQQILQRQLEFGNSSYFTDKTRAIIGLLESLASGRGAA